MKVGLKGEMIDKVNIEKIIRFTHQGSVEWVSPTTVKIRGRNCTLPYAVSTDPSKYAMDAGKIFTNLQTYRKDTRVTISDINTAKVFESLLIVDNGIYLYKDKEGTYYRWNNIIVHIQSPQHSDVIYINMTNYHMEEI